jgi:predicted small lipoprotein YifL
MRTTLLILLMSGLALGCGQRGELYLRDSPPSGVKSSKPEAPKPVPYPAQPAGDDSGATKKP